MWKGPFPWGRSVSYTGTLTIPWGWQVLGGESWGLYRETEGLWFKKKEQKNTQAFLEKEKATGRNFQLLPGSSRGTVLGRAEAIWLACTHTYLSTWMFSPK